MSDFSTMTEDTANAVRAFEAGAPGKSERSNDARFAVGITLPSDGPEQLACSTGDDES